MTLLIGICCDEGIVLAADQQASRAPAGGSPTVGSPITKITEIKERKAVFGFSGYTGLGHQLCAAIEAALDLSQTQMQAVPVLQQTVRGVILPAMQVANIARSIIPNAQMEAICGCFLAARFADGLQLFEVSPQGAFDPIRAMKWACIGSGQPNADPFMSFLWNVFWADRSPNLQEAIVTAYWATKTTIESRAPGVGYDVDVFVLSETDGTFGTRQLSKAELDESEDFIQRAKSAMQSFRDQIIPTPQTEVEDRADEPPVMSEPGDPIDEPS
jgi:20S proteasome alpha/beta subunit